MRPQGRLHAPWLPLCLFSGCAFGTTGLVVATTSLPNAVIGTPYAATLTATGGTPGYTWSQISGGAMPAGISLASTGAFNGTPTATGTFGPYVFQVTDSTGGAASSASLSITATNASLSIADIAGSFTPVVNATADYNGFTSGPVHLQVNAGSSSYSFGSSTLGCLALVFSGPVGGAINAVSPAPASHAVHGSVIRAANSKASTAAVSFPSFVQFSFSLGGFDGTVYRTHSRSFKSSSYYAG